MFFCLVLIDTRIDRRFIGYPPVYDFHGCNRKFLHPPFKTYVQFIEIVERIFKC